MGYKWTSFSHSLAKKLSWLLSKGTIPNKKFFYSVCNIVHSKRVFATFFSSSKHVNMRGPCSPISVTFTLELRSLVSVRNKGLMQIFTFSPSDFHLHPKVIHHHLEKLDFPPPPFLGLPNLRYEYHAMFGKNFVYKQ